MTSEARSDPLDAGLAAGYGPRGGDSVLTILRALAGSVPRLRLRGGEEESGAPADNGQRYEILGEIARGGVGVVMRGRDVDLGRDVALKVIRPEYATNPDVVRRFVEEAQIGGQLQHPGIVPVYELGLHEGRKAYFAMKLVKGRTLSSLLQDRHDPAEGRRRFLSIFEQVCQTVAYAHSRGVIHRDLKPSNVMVGAFGEVQVVDWGFAKVLAHGGVADERRASMPEKSVIRTVRTGSTGSESQAGAVMGTPAYMPPEQALGLIDSLDERADVFALGAILSEILTGQPPYLAESGDLLVQAAKGELEATHARLAACGADAELVTLARACLQADAAARPRHAGDVAKAVAAWSSSVEERARRAELVAAEERVKAAEEKKRRRLTLGLAAAVLGTVVVGGGAYGWFAKERIDRLQRNTLAARDALAEAGRLEAEARSTGEIETWKRAALAARGAEDLTRTVETDSPTVLRARETRERIEQGRATAEAAARRRADDEAMTEKLGEIRTRRGDAFSLRDVHEEYARAFAAYGIDLDALPEAEAAERIWASAVRDRLCEALDDWAFVHTMYGQPEDATRLSAVALAADPDPWRARLRRANGAREELADLARTDPATLSPWSIMLLARGLAAAENPPAGVAYLRAAQPLHPEDFWINMQLGMWLLNGDVDEPRPDEAAGFLRAALAAQPSSWEARHQLGIALEDGGHHDAAIAMWKEALRRAPAMTRARHLHRHILEALHAKGELAAMLPQLEAEAAADADDALAHYRLGVAYRLLQQPDRAVKAFQQAVDLDPEFWEARYGLGRNLWQLRRYDEAIAQYRELTSRRPAEAGAWYELGMIHGEQGKVEEAIRYYERAIQVAPSEPTYRVRLAVARARTGRPTDAMREYEAMRKRFPRSEVLPYVAMQLAQTLGNQGWEAEGRAVAEEEIPLLKERLVREPDSVELLVCLGALLGDRMWDFDGAIEKFEKARALAPDQPHAYFNLGIINGKKGNRQEALKWFGTVVERWPNFPDARVELAFWLVEDGRVDETIPLLAAEVGRRKVPLARFRLGFALLHAGRTEEALAQLRQWYGEAEGNGRYPEERWAEDCAVLAQLATRADALLAGEIEPASPRERVLFATLCYEWSDSPRATREFAAAFAADPRLADEPSCYERGRWRWRAIYAHACMHAGMAGSRCAEALGEEEARALRARSLAAFREEVAALERKLETSTAPEVVDTLAAFRAWCGPVRYGDRLARLPEAEQRDWAAYWKDVDRLWRRAQALK